MAEANKGPNVAKLIKLLESARELHTKTGMLLDEFDELLGGGAGIASQMKQFETAFDTAWCARYAAGMHGRYIWRKQIDVPNIKRLLKALGLVELVKRATVYISNDDPFLTRSRHPFGLFVSGINSYAGEGEAPDLELSAQGPIDCKHLPRCSSEQEHTKKKQAEMRA